MGVKTFTEEIACPVAPARLFKAMMIENDHLLPKLLPQEIKSVEIVHGNGEVGSIKQTNFVEGGPFTCMKHRLDAIDEANFSCKYSLIGGDVLPVDKLEKVTHEVKIEPAGAGCVVKSKIHFHIKGDIELPEEELKANKEKAMGTFKAVEAYLIANPSACA